MTSKSSIKKRVGSSQTPNGAASKTSNEIQSKSVDHESNGHHKTKKSGGRSGQSSPKRTKESESELMMSAVNCFIGFGMMCVAGYMHQQFVYQMHENTMWFTNIKEVEREISFRTEAGLYYSYFKQVVNGPFIQGVADLTKDNQTEHPDTINVLARMNIYQEVFLAAVHKGLNIQTEPILFYVHSVFALQAFLIAGLYLMTWLLSGSWLAALLTAVFFSFNRYDTTRVFNSISLRESFSLPFIWIQGAAFTLYFKPQISKTLQKLSVCAILTSTFMFCLCWQFNQFIMMLQSFALFGVWVLGFLPSYKVRNVILCQLTSLLLVGILQFGNKMIISSWAVGFMLAFLAILFLWGRKPLPNSFCGNMIRVIGLSSLSLVAMAVISSIIKVILRVDSDEHISKFVLNKFGVGDERDFDSRLYLCLGVFGFITKDVFERLTSNLVLPFYIPTHLLLMCALVYTVFNKWRGKKQTKNTKTGGDGNASFVKDSGTSSQGGLNNRPELVFHIVQAVFFGGLALFTLRMKYFWTPYICVFAAVGISEYNVWNTLLHYLKIRNKYATIVVRSSVVIVVLAVVIKTSWNPTVSNKVFPGISGELEKLSEFWDPDTVELMEWISDNTAPTAAFTGSMQLLAGVKLCTGRRITNHPHYEDKYLRHKTKELYQIYGRQSPEDVHTILKRYGSNYIILEDSICRAPSWNGCRLPDVIDIDNGVMPEEPVPIKGLTESTFPRFCEAVRHQTSIFTKYFKTVLVNRTFRVYQVL